MVSTQSNSIGNIERYLLIILPTVCLLSQSAFAQTDKKFGSYPPFTEWYENPLGFHPLSLHTSSGVVIPAIITGAVLFLSSNDSTIAARVSVSMDLGFTSGYYGSFSSVLHRNIGIHYLLRRYLSIGLELTQVYVFDDDNQTTGVGVRPMVRFFAFNNEHIKMYFTSGAGIIFFHENFPQPSGYFGDMREGTQFNGCPKYGVAAEFPLTNRLNVHTGLWHIHFSNGNTPSTSRNPGHDSNGVSIGWSYTM